MRILSTTIMDGRVVELTADEWRDFCNLARSLEGKTEAESNWQFQGRKDYSYETEMNLSGVFGAILAFAEANFRVTEFKNLINKIDSYLKVREQ